MPDFWEFPTVSMGLGPLAAIYQARFNRYLHNRGITDTSQQRVWAFLGDGEMDEPESLSGISLAAREGLDNLTFVVNCNLQRLDGPVRGNGKIIQELEGVFRGAGWNVIKVIWGREWDELLARDADGVLVEKMNTTVDGEFQKYSTSTGAYVREHFFGPDPRLRKLVEHLSDGDIERLRRGGHDYRKVYAAYKAATEHQGAPTVILAKTVKGWTLGKGVEARNFTHQVKKLREDELHVFRDRLELPIPDDKLSEAPYFHPGSGSEEVRVHARAPGVARRLRAPARRAIGAAAQARPGRGCGVRRRQQRPRSRRPWPSPACCATSCAIPGIGKRIVPIIPDEARTFGIDPLFKEVGIYAAHGQRYTPVDSELLLSYRESIDGQVLEEGINEAGSMASFQAAGTTYATHGEPMIPFYMFYSMFGFQRTGDQVWAFGDQRGRGFMIGATAGRTTLAGEGLQHDDGHTQVLASTVPVIRAYDPAFAFELAAVVRDGIERMYTDGEDVFYYVTVYNENYAQPAMPEGAGEGIVRGLYRFAEAPEIAKAKGRVRLVGSGSIMQQVLAARDLLAEQLGIAAEVYSATSFQQLRHDALQVERWNRLHPEKPPRVPYVAQVLGPDGGPVIVATDWMKTLPDLVAPWAPQPYIVLGTDGFGRSDTREALRAHFEIDPPNIAAAALAGLVRAGGFDPKAAAKAIRKLGLDPEAPDPLTV